MSMPRLVTLKEAAEILRMSTHTVRARVRDGRLRPTRVCRRLLFDPEELARFIAASRLQSPEFKVPERSDVVQALH
jgi:excisionase family DNA binding protein